MERVLRDLVERLRAKTAIRRRRALRQALSEMEQRRNQEASIWKSGKGGYHYDR